MSRFKPIRASSPPKTSSKRSVAAVSDIFDGASTTTPSLSPELASLTPNEIDFIDAVIQRASPSASTFLTVFKVYSELLQERGVDPEQEVVFYNKLLKVGTIKGKNWGEKWDMVKRQQRPEAGPSRSKVPVSSTATPIASRAKVLTRLTGALKAIERDEDAFTLHSHQEDTEATESVAATETDGDLGPTFSAVTPRAATTIRRPVSPTLTATTNSLGLSTVPSSSVYGTRHGTPAYKSTRRPQATRAPVWDAETSEATVDTAQASSSKPPSYGAATRTFDTPTKTKSSYTPLRALAKAQSKAAEPSPPVPMTSHPAPPSAKAAVLEARQRSGSVINEADTWKKIEMARYEEDAARFYEERLLERCWNVWHQGYQWIVVCLPSICHISQQIPNTLPLFIVDHKRANCGGEGQPHRSSGSPPMARPNSLSSGRLSAYRCNRRQPTPPSSTTCLACQAAGTTAAQMATRHARPDEDCARQSRQQTSQERLGTVETRLSVTLLRPVSRTKTDLAVLQEVAAKTLGARRSRE